ncbi:MAG TPA: ThiF family adenylyltransferase, partial [Chthonomonadaceae bacterium]|nr:ThiF family adenylyltransferase [Chthonomonadaceae bacterium]
YDLGLGVFRDADIVIGCLDSLDARLAVNRACMRAGTPWLNGAIELAVAEISLFENGEGACFECGMSAEMWERRGRRTSCAGLRGAAPEAPAPTTPVVASLAAAYLVQEAVHVIHARRLREKPGLAYGAKITVNLDPYETAVFALSRNPECMAHERVGTVTLLSEPPHGITAAALLSGAGASGGSLELGFDLVSEMRCAACGAVERVLMPLERCGEERVRCPDCGAESRCPETISWLAADDPLAGLRLADLGVPDHQVLCVKNGDDRGYYQLAGAPIWPEGDEG